MGRLGTLGIASTLALVVVGGATAASCASTTLPLVGVGGGEPAEPGPGEDCWSLDDVDAQFVTVRFEPSELFLAPGQTKTVRVVLEPDFCDVIDVALAGTSTEAITSAALDAGELGFEYGTAAREITVSGTKLGTATVTATVPGFEDVPSASATLTVDVADDALEVCAAGEGNGDELVDPDPTTPAEGADPIDGDVLTGTGTLARASIELPGHSSRPNENGFQWSVPSFDASIACADSIAPGNLRALGPAVTFGPEPMVFPRDMPLSIPINPTRMPEKARLRHLKVVYSGPKFKEPRVIPVTDPRVVREVVVDPQTQEDKTVWRLTFQADRLGTFQAAVDPAAGTKVRTRRITHRAVIGVSMGGAGTQQFGIRHHHLFDVVAPLGGPTDWTWLTHHLERNHMGGFRSIPPGTQLADIPLTRTPCTTGAECQSDETCIGITDEEPVGLCTIVPAADETYEHGSAFNGWWYEFPSQGNGGSFDREEYLQIFRDLTYMYGNPVGGYNPDALNLPAGVDPNHPSVVGDHPDRKCAIYVDPYDGAPDDAQELWSQCPQERCQYVQKLENYYDDEYNPDGTFPVITFCDGATQRPERTPYSNWWTDENNRFPMEVALAVDYNDNGVRDEMEPVIRNGHEPWDDWGSDATPSELEPGYDPITNQDPAGDDYHPRYNPTGLEGDMRWQPGEPFRDHGLDGVDGTSTSPYDWGEDDGEFTVSPGLQYFWDVDAHSIVRGWSSLPTVPFDEQAMARLDVWTDGGIRDLFNFAIAGEHFLGGFTALGKGTGYISGTNALPGLDPNNPEAYAASQILWEDIPGGMNFRYGNPDLTPSDITNGSGQHVGTVNELLRRLQTALYFIDSRWPDAHRAWVKKSSDADVTPITDDPSHPQYCETQGNCTFDFTASDGRTGPVGVTLPPGYGLEEQQDVRYPVVYMLHGYGMTPEDLQAAIVFLANWMNGNTDSQATRLGKAILVYVDGRCRVGDDGKAECIRGTFFADSPRPDGAQLDTWWRELIDHIDQRYRTMPESTIEWTD